MQNLSNEKSPSRRKGLVPLQREDVPGCKQCPLEITIRPLWANGEEGYFLSARGTKLKLYHTRAMRKKGSKANNGKRGLRHPNMREQYNNASAHRIMAYTYADEPCPIFFDSKGKPYKGIVHHVVENPYDFRVDNLIWWLDHHQHHIADNRRRALEQVLPNMYAVPTIELKRIQDPRRTSDEVFDRYLIRMKKVFEKIIVVDPSARMDYELTHHMEV